ncbi:unnamed protein product [Vitrella brassicaformis CCMP3155]|uniref:EF-hand domain-containing protein n=1 Tax=Vitrella brassicaformis (strain CCMP3155) TaxID=1169540 RepID=A0A0G4FEL4_VITBC|nr:unnamed protein product [Vitrella brassicaformis CCMP3155]|eukprot:CEM11623.1 unnamed protein product [Vitrella brassicaformis CCMP3155]
MSSSAPTMAVPPPPASAAQHDDGHCKVHAHIPTMNRTETFKKVTAASGQTGDEAQRIVELLRHWDSDKDGLFSVENVLQAAQTVLKEQRRNRMLRWVVVGVLVAYIVTLALLLGITYGAIEMAKDAKPDEDAVLRATHLANKDVVRTKSKVDVWSPFDVVDKSLADMEKVRA